MKKGVVFSIFLAAVLFFIFWVHIGVLYLMKMDLFSNRIILSYIVNYVLAISLLAVLQRSVLKKSTHTAFIFMAASAIKFIVFFVAFYPSYTIDNVMQTSEFAAFFVPYALCLLLEVIFLSKQLNNQTYSSENTSE